MMPHRFRCRFGGLLADGQIAGGLFAGFGIPGWSVAAWVCLAGIGCDSPAVPVISDAPKITVSYAGNPLADVHVRLHDSPGGPVIAQAVSDDAGHATFDELPVPEPAHYFVSMESVGDGGWILDAKMLQRENAARQWPPFATTPIQRIELPPGSVKTLSP